MYFTPLAFGGGPATYFLFLEVSAEAPRLFFDFPPLGFIPNSRKFSVPKQIRSRSGCRFLKTYGGR